MISTAARNSDFDLTQILNGVRILAPSPLGYHQLVLGRMFYQFQYFLNKEKLGEVFTSPLDVILEEGLNVVQPDLIYIKKENMSIFHPNGHIKGIPDLLVEIISPGSVSRDTVEKFAIYERLGVKEYWIIFPEKKAVEVFSLKEGKYFLYSSSKDKLDKIRSLLLPNFHPEIKSLFEKV
jgi:Uma2 family endonuclease